MMNNKRWLSSIGW